MLVRRRVLLAVLAMSAASACAPVRSPQEPTPQPSSSALIDNWRASGLEIVADALSTLRTFDVFAAYRVSVTPGSGFRLPSTLAWDPPTGAAWDDATRVSRGLHDRADQLFMAISTASIDATLWRAQRQMADTTHDLMDLGDALQAYRDRVDGLPPGDASGPLDLLDRAWARWDAVAVRLGTSRSEPVACPGIAN
jgi:hypothetical protein